MPSTSVVLIPAATRVRSSVFRFHLTNSRWRFAFLVLSLLLSHAAHPMASSKYSIEVKELVELRCAVTAQPPLKTPEAAACVAAGIAKVQDAVAKAQKDARYSAWKVVVSRTEDRKAWDVRISSAGTILPAYKCSLYLSEQGTLIERDGIFIDCGYSK